MKRLKIRTRMTLLYTGMLMIFMIICFSIIWILFAQKLDQTARSQIMQDASTIANQVEYEEEHQAWDIDIDDDELENINVHNLFSIYSLDNEILSRNHKQNWIEILEKDFDGVRVIDHNDLPWLAYDMPVYDDGEEIAWLRIIAPMSGTIEVNNDLRTMFFWSLLMGLLFSIICGQWIARRALAPIKQIIATAQEIEQGDLSQRIGLKNTDEIGELASAFDSMVDTVENSFQREKQLTSDASHELRTPISIIMAYAEEGLQNNAMAQEEYREIFDVIYQKSTEMNQMLSQMLWFARNCENESSLQMEKLDISIITKDIAQEMEIQAELKQISIETDIQNDLYVYADLMLFTRMTINLIDNAIKYGKENGHIWITLKQDKNYIIMSIRDDGQGIDQKELPDIFERFYQSDQSRSSRGIGLGLSMVAAIVKKHSGQIEVKSKLGEGTQFVLQFPMIEDIK